MAAITRRSFLSGFAAGVPAVLCSRVGGARETASAERRPNILLITADDMNYDTPGVTGCTVPGITPNIDRLASEGLRFIHSHVTAAVCQPSRQCMMTGRYPHTIGAPGFDPIRQDVPTLQEHLEAGGYVNGILSKVDHLAPVPKFRWTTAVRGGELDFGRGPRRYYEATGAFLETAKASGKPFFLMANSQDPHRPFAGSEGELQRFGKHWPVSRTYRPDEVEVPGFLEDLPDVRKELAQYLTSVRRCDDTVGEVLRALRESGLEEDTLVMFLSDNGMAFPYAKTNCYPASTRTPWIVRWPGRVKPGIVDETHLISGIDFAPTILEAAGLPEMSDIEGRSFLPILLGRETPGRDSVYTVFNITSARNWYPMRCIQDRRYGYIFNAWSDGTTAFKNESQSGLTMQAMRNAAETDPAIEARVRFFLHRVPEEFYDYANDPDARDNLIDRPELQNQIEGMRGRMLDVMVRTQDPLLDAFQGRLAAGSGR